jgi:VanZ family protein
MKWLTILFALFLLFIIILADTGNLGMLYRITRLPYADKAGHFLLFGILALLVDLTLFRALPPSTALRTSRKRIAVVSGLILALLVGLEEFSQQYFADRTFSLSDLTASYLGLISFSWLAVRARCIVPLPWS